MVFGCLTSSKYTMKADLLREEITQDASGQIRRVWVFDKTIDVEAHALGNLRGKQSGTSENWRNFYIAYDYIRVKTSNLVTKGNRLTNVKDANGVSLWNEYDQDGLEHNPTVFAVQGVSPSIDAFGGFVEYEVFANRAGVQV